MNGQENQKEITNRPDSFLICSLDLRLPGSEGKSLTSSRSSSKDILSTTNVKVREGKKRK